MLWGELQKVCRRPQRSSKGLQGQIFAPGVGMCSRPDNGAEWQLTLPGRMQKDQQHNIW